MTRSRTLPDTKTLVKDLDADTFTGSLPSWLSTSGAGAVTAEDASNDGGRWVLDPGTAASGDSATAETSFSLDTAAYDVVEFEFRIRVTTTTTNDGQMSVSILDANDNNGLQYSLLNNSAKLNDQLAKLVSGARTAYAAPEQNDTDQHVVRIEWNVAEGTATAFIDGMPSNEADVSDVPDGDYSVKFNAKYNGGSAMQLEIYRFTLRYHKLPNK